jgi:hypothetical protein
MRTVISALPVRGQRGIFGHGSEAHGRLVVISPLHVGSRQFDGRLYVGIMISPVKLEHVRSKKSKRAEVQRTRLTADRDKALGLLLVESIV